MKIAVIVDSFPPVKNSAAIQVGDLVDEILHKQNDVTVFTSRRAGFSNGDNEGITHDRLRVVRTWVPFAGSKYRLFRALSEISLPIFMFVHSLWARTQFSRWDIVIWYSPSIFASLFAKSLSLENNGFRYLILRDIFPDWAVDLGLIAPGGLVHTFFTAVANQQYRAADVIGIQTEGNAKYLSDIVRDSDIKVEVLRNWLSPPSYSQSPISLDKTQLGGREIVVYAGNLGVAQGLDCVFSMLRQAEADTSLGFIFLGDGSERDRLVEFVATHELSNTLVFDPILPTELNALMRQCSVGLITLDARHSSHNIPGKLLSYLRAGLPVCANVNDGNDIISYIEDRRLGACNLASEPQLLLGAIKESINLRREDPSVTLRCRGCFEEDFSTEKIVNQIFNSHPR